MACHEQGKEKGGEAVRKDDREVGLGAVDLQCILRNLYFVVRGRGTETDCTFVVASVQVCCFTEEVSPFCFGKTTTIFDFPLLERFGRL